MSLEKFPRSYQKLWTAMGYCINESNIMISGENIGQLAN